MLIRAAVLMNLKTDSLSNASNDELENLFEMILQVFV